MDTRYCKRGHALTLDTTYLYIHCSGCIAYRCRVCHNLMRKPHHNAIVQRYRDKNRDAINARIRVKHSDPTIRAKRAAYARAYRARQKTA